MLPFFFYVTQIKNFYCVSVIFASFHVNKSSAWDWMRMMPQHWPWMKIGCHSTGLQIYSCFDSTASLDRYKNKNIILLPYKSCHLNFPKKERSILRSLRLSCLNFQFCSICVHTKQRSSSFTKWVEGIFGVAVDTR